MRVRRATPVSTQFESDHGDWREDAACKDYEPEAWFCHIPAGDRSEDVKAAKDVCLSCPVRGECLRWALDVPEQFGIWGATTPTERRNLRRAEQRRQQREAS